LAVLLTLGAFMLYWRLALLEECRLFGRFFCTSKLDLFWGASPNEMGDALAGIAGGLVLIWVIAATFMQSRELRQARDEYAKMAKALNAQAEIFKDEQRERAEARAERELNQLIRSLSRKVEYLSRFQKPFLATASVDSDFYKKGEEVAFTIFSEDFCTLSEEAQIEDLGRCFLITVFRRGLIGPSSSATQRLTLKEDVQEMRHLISDAVELEGRLAPDQKIRLRRFHLDDAITHLDKALETNLWSENLDGS